MSKASVAVPRVLLGLMLTVFGAMGLLHLIPPQTHTGIAGEYINALNGTYLFTFIKLTELTTGLALLANRFVPLALMVLAPISINILGFHTLIEPGQPAIAIVLIGLQLWLAWKFRSAYAALLKARAIPEASPSPIARHATA